MSSISSLEIQTSAKQSKELTSIKQRNHPIAKVMSFDLELQINGNDHFVSQDIILGKTISLTG